MMKNYSENGKKGFIKLVNGVKNKLTIILKFLMKKQLTLFYRLFVELFFFGGLSEIHLIKQSLSNLKKLILFGPRIPIIRVS